MAGKGPTWSPLWPNHPIVVLNQLKIKALVGKANLNPPGGSGQAGFRPVVVISGNLLNENLPVAIVMPLTSNVKNYKGNPILKPSKVNGLKVSTVRGRWSAARCIPVDRGLSTAD